MSLMAPPHHVSSADVADASPALRTSHIADAADQLGIRGATGMAGMIGAGGLSWLGGGGPAVIGPACTLQQQAVAPERAEPPPPLRHAELAARLAPPGSIIVIAVAGTSQGANYGATWGEAHTLRARNRGVAGVLLDGLTRDADGLRARGFPIACRGATPLRSTGRLETVSVGAPVTVGGVVIRPGDVIALDSDGFVCLPPERAEEVLDLARAIAAREQQRDRELDRAAPALPTSLSASSSLC